MESKFLNKRDGSSDALVEQLERVRIGWRESVLVEVDNVDFILLL